MDAPTEIGSNRHVAFLGGPGMTYEEIPPPPELAPWIAVLWRITSDVHSVLRIPPDGCMDLIGGDVIGSLSGSLTATFNPGDTAEGIRFHSGGFPALFGVPATELLDLRVPVAEVLPRFRGLRQLARQAPPPTPSSGSRTRRAIFGSSVARAATATASSAVGCSPPRATGPSA